MPKITKLEPFFQASTNRWVLNIPPNLSENGKRSRQHFADESAALDAAAKIRQDREDYGKAAKAISQTDIEITVKAKEMLRSLKERTGVDLSLLDCVADAVARAKQGSVSVTLEELFDEYGAALAPGTHKTQIRYIGKRYEKAGLGERIVSDITAIDLLEAFGAFGKCKALADGSINRYIRILRALWNFALDRPAPYVTYNVANRLPFIKPKTKGKTVRIFSNATIKAMLDLALKEQLEFVPFLALGAFAGIRAEGREMYKLLWSDIHFEEKQIVVRAEIAKTHKRRFIPISDNLEAWLKVYIEKKGIDPTEHKRVIKLPYGTLRKVRKSVIETAAPTKKWIPAGLRHTFTSAMINSGKSIDETILALGHEGKPTLLWNNYFLRTSKEVALEYWQIRP
jgi:integrase